MNKERMKIEAVLISICLVLFGCTTTKVVTVDRVKTDTTFIVKHQRDSVWKHDSIRISEKGDTISIERWHTKYVEREVHDTLYQSKCDSIPVPYEVIKEVPRERNTVELVLMIVGCVTLMLLLIWIANRVKRFLPGMW